MLELTPEDRPTAIECLKHEYFVSQGASLIMDEQDEGIDLSENLVQFKEKYRNLKGGVTDSIHFNPNPTMNGVVNTYGSIGGSSNQSGRIDSFNSVNRAKAQNKAINKLKGENSRKRSSIYKYALMKGGKGVDIQKELEKMCNASMDSYNSEGTNDSDSESEGS